MFSKKDIFVSLKKIGLRPGDNILVKSDLRYLGEYEVQNSFCKDLFDAFSKIINLNKGTIIVSTASTYLCNTNHIFDLKNTKSERGIFSNYYGLKIQRSVHPFLFILPSETCKVCLF